MCAVFWPASGRVSFWPLGKACQWKVFCQGCLLLKNILGLVLQAQAVLLGEHRAGKQQEGKEVWYSSQHFSFCAKTQTVQKNSDRFLLLFTKRDWRFSDYLLWFVRFAYLLNRGYRNYIRALMQSLSYQRMKNHIARQYHRISVFQRWRPIVR